MIKKKLFLLLILFLISGCSVNYDLIIDNDSISEDVYIKIPMSEVTDDRYEKQINYPMRVYGGKDYNYNQEISDDEENHFVNYSYKHDIDNYKKSLFISMCYDSGGITVDNDTIAISTSNVFRCIAMDDGFRAKNVDVNIKTKLKVLENNADEIKGNTYTWHMNEYEYSAKPIKLTIQKNKTVIQKIDRASNLGIFVVISFLLFVGILIYLFVKIKHKKNSEF